ncbi:glycosyltransferase [Micromonospora sp. NPDC049301]|uniref:glycosyltransferase n=1 Tax=Micromonospora sp. NPDC049301 TaxID=3155723 RepID=UPI003438ABBB
MSEWTAPPPCLLVISSYRLPDGDAMSNRVLGLVRSAVVAEEAVVVNDWPSGTTRPAAGQMPAGIRLVSLDRRASSRPARLWYRYWLPVRVAFALHRAGIRRSELASVYLTLGQWSLTMWVVLRLVVRRPVIVDVMERFDPQQFRWGRFDARLLRHRWQTYLAAHLADRVIAISTELYRRFSHRRPTLVVPPQVDLSRYPPSSAPPLAGGLRLLYAGTAGPKDLLAVVVDAIRQLPAADRGRVRLTIAGMTRAQAADMSDLDPACLDGLDLQVMFLGRVSRDRVLAELARTHFAVLVRPDAGYARSGFPSKVPEALAAGCPVLLNHTGDLARYVTDGREGLVLAGPSAADVRDGLLRALTLSDGEWWEMSRAARSRAADFDFRAWTETVSKFVVGAHRDVGASQVSRVLGH